MKCKFCQAEMREWKPTTFKKYYGCDGLAGCGAECKPKAPLWLLPVVLLSSLGAFYFAPNPVVAWVVVIVLVVALFTYKKEHWTKGKPSA
jgi:hypothetical protein